MATSSRSTERFKYGICLNDECSLCKEKKVQQIPMRKDLVCTECSKPLRECPPPKQGPDWKKIAAIIGAIAGIAAIGGGIYALTGASKSKEPLKLTLNHMQKTLKVGETDTLTATVTPENTQATIEWKASNKSNAIEVSSDGIVTAKEEGKSKVQAKASANGETINAICEYTVEKADIEEQKPQTPPVSTPETPVAKSTPTTTPTPPAGPTTGSLKLSYGTYTGQIKGGYPNGQGRLVYSTSRQISKYDQKGRTAQAGESVQGNFKNGFLTIGKHYDSNGNLIESLNIGSPVDGVFEAK